jgi:hypothetical protein
VASEPRSRVAFDIEPAGELVKLTVIDDDFERWSTAATLARHGWPMFPFRFTTPLEMDEPFASTRITRGGILTRLPERD